MQIETQGSKNHFIFFSNVKLELWKGTLIWNKKSHDQNQQKIFFEQIFRDIWSVNNSIEMAAFFKHAVILYYTRPNFLTLKVATYLKR